MSATELIAKIKALSPSEQANFARLFEYWQTGGEGDRSESAEAKAKTLAWPNFMERLRRNFPDGLPSGLPTSSLVDQGRGEF